MIAPNPKRECLMFNASAPNAAVARREGVTVAATSPTSLKVAQRR
jgi:hypothetical protein